MHQCPKCHSDHSRKRGTILLSGSKVYQRLQCTVCGTVYRGALIPKNP